MRFRLRTLLILLAAGSALIWFRWLLLVELFGDNPLRPRVFRDSALFSLRGLKLYHDPLPACGSLDRQGGGL